VGKSRGENGFSGVSRLVEGRPILEFDLSYQGCSGNHCIPFSLQMGSIKITLKSVAKVCNPLRNLLQYFCKLNQILSAEYELPTSK